MKIQHTTPAANLNHLTKILSDLKGDNIKDSFQKTTTEELALIPKPQIKPEEEAPWIKDQMPAKNLGTGEDGLLHIGNVRCGFKEAAEVKDWEPVFKEISLNPDKVKDVYIVIEPFAPEWIAGHALSYFEFEDDGQITTSDGKTSNGLVLSIEARLKEGQSYSLIDGMKNKFKNIYQLGTWEDFVQKGCRRAGHKLIRYKLNLSKEEKKELLKKNLEEAFKDRSNDYYNTLRNSCYSNQVRMINSVLPEERKINEWIIPNIVNNPGANIPNAAGFALGSAGIIENAPPVITEPDKTLFPDKQVKTTFIGNTLKAASDTKGWEFMSGLTGMALGTALGSLVLPPVLAIPTTGLIGGVVGLNTGEWIKRETHRILEPSEKYL